MARTKSGCWTCRLQTKKKCDEAKPQCNRCSRLGVHCFGYGLRPSQQELREDRRALLASVGAAASRTEHSIFRVWRLRPAQHESQAQIDKPTAERRQKNSSQQPSWEAVASHSNATCLITTDRVNSGMLDFFHPQLLANYTNEVFWLNSRFYQSPGPYEGNSWMKTFIVRSKETHLAAALMGLTWWTLQKDTSRIINIDFTRPLVLLYSLVIQSVKDQVVRSQSATSSEEVMLIGANLGKCATLLLSFELWRIVEGDWLNHIRGMRDILQWILSQVPAALNAAMKIKIEGLTADDESNLMIVAPATDIAMNFLALKWFVQSYAWVDIVSVIWVGPQYMQSRWHNFYGPLLQEGHLQMDRFMGCEDWVLYSFFKISKIEEGIMNMSNPLNIEGSSSDVMDIEQRLNTGLVHAVLRRRQYSHGPERDIAFITEMWIHAALVYHHIVTVGSRSGHLTLRRYVARGLYAYVNLPRRLDIYIAMPFGVLASMANDKEIQNFLKIAELPRVMGEINPGQLKILKIIKECCRMRANVEVLSPSAGVSWREGARSLGLVVLPV
ncbi:hypothetical protein V8C42DRAFT_336439 [Trichoderma barbatum]